MNMKKLISAILGLLPVLFGFAQSITWVAKPQYDKISSFHDGVAVVSVNNKWGYINQQGIEVVKPEFDRTYDFSEGMGVVVSSDGQLKGIANSNGILKVPVGLKVNPRFPKFSDGLLLVTDGKKWGYLNKSGELQIKCNYWMAHPFSEGMAAVTTSANGWEGWAYIRTSGSVAITQDRKISCGTSFSQGKAAAIISKKLVFIDNTGKVVEETPHSIDINIQRKYDSQTGELKLLGGSAFLDEQGKLASIEVNGETKSYGETSPNPEISTKTNLVQTKKEGNKLGFIFNGKESPCQFDEVSWYDHRTAIVRKGAKFGIVSMTESDPLSISANESTTFSVFGKPANTVLVIKNLQAEPVNNISLTFSDGTQQFIEQILPKGTKEIAIVLSKTTDAVSEDKEIEIRPEIDGILQNLTKIKVVLTDKPSLNVEVEKTSYEASPGENVSVSFKVINESDVSGENISIRVVDGSKTIFMKKISVLKGDESVLSRFDVSVQKSQTKKLEIITKPNMASELNFEKEIFIKIIDPGYSPPPPPPPVH